MIVYIVPLRPAADELSISPIDLVPKVVKFCRKNNVDKIVVERLPIVATGSRATKSEIQVNIDAFVKLCVSRGVQAISYTPTTEYPVVSMQAYSKHQQEQAIEQVDRCRFTEGNTLVIATPTAIGLYRDAEDIDEQSTFFTGLTEAGHVPTFVKEINHDFNRR